MGRKDYVGLLELRCKFYTDHDYVPARGGDPIFVPANMAEKIFFRIVVPDFNVEQAQLTGSRVYIAKLWDERAKTMVDVSDETGVATCLDSQTSGSGDELVKAAIDLRRSKNAEKAYLPFGERNVIIGFPRPIIGVYIELDSKEVHDRLKLFDIGHLQHRDLLHRLHIGKGELGYSGYIPVENIIGYETPKRFVTKTGNGFTGEMLIDWPPSVKFAESIIGRPMTAD